MTNAADAWDGQGRVYSLPVQGAPDQEEPTYPFTRGADFLFGQADLAPAIWGRGTDILMAEGEALILAGGDGVGKTTIAGQFVRARLGLSQKALGLPVVPSTRRVLYLAMDRPRQARRALSRHFSAEDTDVLNDKLAFWEGPPPYDLAQNISLLTRMCERADADTVIVDSLKDAALELTKDDVGSKWNRARQTALQAGIQCFELHHHVKRGADGHPPRTLADLYGSRWIAAGAGSVIALHGEPGDLVVELRHLKQPMNEIGPWKITHDHERGVSMVLDETDPLAIVDAAGSDGMSLSTLTTAMFGKDTPNNREKARRRVKNTRDLITKGGGPREPTWIFSSRFSSRTA